MCIRDRFYASYGSWSGTVEAPADTGEHAYWYTESGYGITVYRERTEEDKPAEKTPEQLARCLLYTSRCV